MHDPIALKKAKTELMELCKHKSKIGHGTDYHFKKLCKAINWKPWEAKGSEMGLYESDPAFNQIRTATNYIVN